MNNLNELRAALARLADNRSAEFQQGTLRRYLPLPAHTRALQTEIAVISGAAGSGKTALFQALAKTTDAAAFFATTVPSFTWIEGFANNEAHPAVIELDAFAATADDAQLQLFWTVHLARRLAVGLEMEDAFREEGLPETLLGPAVQQKVPFHALAVTTYSAFRFLQRVDNALKARGQYGYVGYDGLDLLGQWSREVNTRFAATLLALWASFGARFYALRPKIFLRADLFERAVRRSVDASKLRGRHVDLAWSVPDLYRVVVRHMAAEAELRGWLDEVAPGLVVDVDGRGAMPRDMPEDVQKSFATALAGPFMGAGTNKGFTHRWIPNHLQDGLGRRMPRSMLVLLGKAGDLAAASPPPTETLVGPKQLVKALDETSKARVAELTTEFPIVRRMEHLRNLVLMLPEEEVADRLSKPVDDEDRETTNGPEVVERFVGNLGLLVRRRRGDESVIDVPDLFRAGYGIKRPGGAAG